MGGWGQAVWMWDNILPRGLAPVALLLWTGMGVAGITLALYWLAHRVWLIAWLATAAWLAVPAVMELGGQYDLPADTGPEWLYTFAPLILLLLLGVGLSGAMMVMAWYAGRRWSGEAPKLRPLREALLSGLFVLFCGLLLMSRAFTLGSAVLLACALILLESFIVVRESTPEQVAEIGT
jgi:hypothetical protein